MPLSDEPPDELRRLGPAWYRGTAWVHWTMTIGDRKRGWLTSSHLAALREILIHTCTRHRLMCPAFCLMPDHAHFLFTGLCQHSDQRNAMKFLRTHWQRLLSASGHALQKQGYDHVLDESERNPDAFEDTVNYIFQNPVRAGLTADWTQWEHLGAIAAGYPELDPREGIHLFRERFRKIHHRERRRYEGWEE